ncbi:serine/threonine protein kinase [Opitutus sp. GAS368]|nr:serine/threonine protein kinase [Opitutus sp. GAS368]
MIQESATPMPLHGAAPTAALPLADVTCCRAVPEVCGSVEPSAEPQLRPDQVLDGRFLIRAAINRNGMATIYRAEDLSNQGREVAIKVPLLGVESSPGGFAHFRHEEEIGLRLAHPFLLRFHPVAGKGGRPYLVTEYLRGCTLDRLAPAARPLAEADALKITGLICEGVGHMHERGVIHRDLKPSNIMICRDQTLRVMDFGLASAPMRRRSVFARLTGIFGTPEYMAPEQVENGPIDERTDVYGLGVILYELLTGSVPFQDGDPWESAYKRTAGDPIAPRKLNPGLSPQAEEIVLHALQRRPRDRYPGMAAFAADLRAPAGVRMTGHAGRLQPPRKKISLQTTPVIAGLLLGFGAIAFFILLFFVLRYWPSAR